MNSPTREEHLGGRPKGYAQSIFGLFFSKNHEIFLVIYAAKCITAYNATAEISIDKIIPYIKGLIPIDFKNDPDKPAPIKKSVTVRPIFARSTIMEDKGCMTGR